MSDKHLRVALAGLGSFGSQLLQALERCRLEFVGLCDQDGALAQQASGGRWPVFDDNRRLLAQTQPQVLLLATPPEASAKILRLASRAGAHVWKQAPLARNLAEAFEFVQLMDDARMKLAVACTRRRMPGYARARQWMSRLGRVNLIQAHYLFNSGPDLGWHGDRASGGGCLLEVGWHMFDLVIWLMGFPDAVFSVAASGQLGPARNRPLYDSDDTAVTVFRYTAKVSATITASRCFSPVSEGLTIYGEKGSLQAEPSRCILRDRDGRVLDSATQEQPPLAVLAETVQEFLSAVEAGRDGYESSGWENLLTMAAVEAAYLSDRTGQAESPQFLLASYNVTAKDCLRHRPG